MLHFNSLKTYPDLLHLIHLRVYISMSDFDYIVLTNACLFSSLHT